MKTFTEEEIRKIKAHPYFEDALSYHFVADNPFRLSLIREKIGVGTQVLRYTWGKVGYIVTDTGLVVVCSVDFSRIVTVLVARPSQLHYHFWRGQQAKAPKSLITQAMHYKSLGWNLI